jgi:serine/threonine protein kinase
MEKIVTQTKKLTINLAEWETLKIVGTGSFGKVKLAKHKKEKIYRAIKMLQKSEILKLKQVDHIYSEYTLLQEIEHQFIVNLKGFTQDKKYIHLVLEYIPGGELFTVLRQVGMFPLSQAKFYAAQIIVVFDYLHSKNIIYRDLKPENILINIDGYLKVTDFGFAKRVDGKTYTICGTPEYLAPEIILNKGHSKPVDWWTLGVLLYEMVVGVDPFNDDDPMGVYQKIIKGSVKFPKDIDRYLNITFSDVKSLLKHLLVADVSKRYGCMINGVQDIYFHRFFRGYDWDALKEMKMTPEYVPKIK